MAVARADRAGEAHEVLTGDLVAQACPLDQAEKGQRAAVVEVRQGWASDLSPGPGTGEGDQFRVGDEAREALRLAEEDTAVPVRPVVASKPRRRR